MWIKACRSITKMCSKIKHLCYNWDMKKQKRGFTLIEVILFLAVTAALFVGIAAGVQGSIFQQRYTDSVQNYAEFLRSVYSQVSNVQSESTGRSDKAIYGKVVTFREKENGKGNVIRTYNLIGDVERTQVTGEVMTDDEARGTVTCGSSVIDRLKCLRANVLIREKDAYGRDTGNYQPVGFIENYTVRWSSEIQTTGSWANNSNHYKVYEGIMLVLHSPSSGNISTYVWDNQDENSGSTGNTDNIRSVIDSIENCAANGSSCGNHDPFGTEGNGGIIWFDDDYFQAKDIDFCVNPNGAEYSTVRRNIRLSEGAHNASAVDVLTEDDTTGSEQGKSDDYDHNRCE